MARPPLDSTPIYGPNGPPLTAKQAAARAGLSLPHFWNRSRPALTPNRFTRARAIRDGSAEKSIPRMNAGGCCRVKLKSSAARFVTSQR